MKSNMSSLRSAVQAEELTFFSRGLELKAKAVGDKKGVKVLALHGWLDNANTFDHLAPFLQGMYILALDLPGHGHSAHRSADSAYYLWEYVQDVLEVIRQLEWGRVHILAHSMGTGVAALLAASFPEKVDQLCFIDGLGPAFVLPQENSFATYFRKSVRQLEMAQRTQLFGFSKAADRSQFTSIEAAIKDRMQGHVGPISRAAAQTLVARDLVAHADGFNWRHDPRLSLPTPCLLTEAEAQSVIKHIKAPVQLILGTEGLFANGLFAQRLACFQCVQQVSLPGNHHFHLDVPAQTVNIIHSFFKTNI